MKCKHPNCKNDAVEFDNECRSHQKESPRSPGCYGLDQRMKDAGMIPVSELLERDPLGKFSAHAGVTDLESFEQWIQSKREEFIRMQARMTLDGQEKDELFEWVVAHNATLGEVMANLRQATGRNP